MRVSQYFDLGRTQPELDFVDVDTSTDSRVFIDPRAIRIQKSAWSQECESLLVSFFHEVLIAVSQENEGRLQALLGRLSEPNETHLGYSEGRSRGRGLGGVGTEKVTAMIADSLASKTGMLSDLEDTALFIPGIAEDIVSDITTHILRGALIGYTHQACGYYRIPMVSQYSGVVWNPNSLEWDEGEEMLPRTDEGPLLLVPKSIVRFRLTLNDDKYFNGFLAPLYENKEVDARSNLVTILKSGPKVNRSDLKKKYPVNKLAVIEYTQEFPGALSRYKSSVSIQSSPVLTHEQLADKLDVPEPDYDRLLDDLRKIPAGNGGAPLYHRAAEKLLTALFYPHLANMRMEREIHEKRKRIDIAYDNLSPGGTFYWLMQYRAVEIPVECKNYRTDPGNPELDQLAGRFSPHRGWVGILTCRKIYDKELFLKRCRDTAKDMRGYIIPLDDADLEELVRERKVVREMKPRERMTYKIIRERMDVLIS
jgi:hypothetical protein